MEGGDSAPASDIFWAKRTIPPPFAPQAAAQYRPVGLPLKASMTGSHRAWCSGGGHLRTWIQQFYRGAGMERGQA